MEEREKEGRLSNQDLMLKAENEGLITGEYEVTCLIWDTHYDHINHHKEILTNPEYKNNPEVVKRTLNHIQEHMESIKQLNEVIL